MPIRGKAKLSIFSLNPNVATIHAVKVVPILEPIITPMAFSMLSTPAPTNAKTMSETAELLCKTAVTREPLPIALNVPFVYCRIMRLKVLPDKDLTASSSERMANRKMPRPARNFHKSKCSFIVFFVSCLRSYSFTNKIQSK